MQIYRFIPCLILRMPFRSTMLLWGGEDELECDVSRDRIEEETSSVLNGFVLEAVVVG